MQQLVTQLIRAREARKMSLTDIADLTLINVQFLRYLEQGNFSFLPQTYVRAFLREYANTVGLDPDEIMSTYNALAKEPAAPAPRDDQQALPSPEQGLSPESEQDITVPQEQNQEADPANPVPVADGTQERITPKKIRLALTVLVVLAAAIVAWNLLTPSREGAVEEVSFESVVKEHEERDRPAETPAVVPAKPDSLTLEAVTTDSVWVLIVADDGKPVERLMRTGTRATWKAAEKFTISVGNASALEFTLNNKPLGPLGRGRTVVRNRVITASALSER